MSASAQETLTNTESPDDTTSNGLASFVITGIDVPSSTDELFIFRISRNTGSGSDTMSGDANLSELHMVFTCNLLGSSTA